MLIRLYRSTSMPERWRDVKEQTENSFHGKMVACVLVLVFLRGPLSEDGPGICEVALDGLGLPCPILAWILEVLLPRPIQQANDGV